MEDLGGLSKLIIACRKAGVTRLKMGEIEVLFGDGTMDFKEWPRRSHVATTEVTGVGEDRVVFERDDSQVLLEDPLAFEEQFEGDTT